MAYVFEVRIETMTLFEGTLKIIMIGSQISWNHDLFFGSHPPCPQTLDMDGDERRQKCTNAITLMLFVV